MKEFIRNLDDVSRRDFAAYLAKACLGVGVAPLFMGSVGANRLAAAAGSSGSAKPRNLIYFYMSGGMTHIDTFDPKPGQEVQGPLGVINTKVAGMRFGEHLTRLAAHADKLAVVNSMRTTTGAHEQGRYIMRTSYAQRGTIQHPSVGSWLVQMTDDKEGDKDSKAKKILPPYVMIGGGSGEATAGWMENKYAPVPLGNASDGMPHGKLNVSKDEFLQRLTLADAFDRPFRRHYQQKAVRTYSNLYEDAISLMNSEELAVFDITKEPKPIRDAYGDNGFGQGCLLARRLVENGVNCVEVHLGGWDTHNDNFNEIAERVPMLDQGLAALLGDLESRGMLDNTVIALATEFGRTPFINQNRGRDHHPGAFSCLLAGAGIKGGQVYGKTDSNGVGVEENPVTVQDFNATIGSALGLSLKKTLHSPSGRPFTFADKGEPIKGLLA